ncbi:MAG TPA: NYN domain-containing protein [Gemmatimonadaceae bacterium]|jgi:uncharacterized protein (TIGR00288 family)|nr:NYN domain-containing protein [Gemmatimonadaceae bacterium]
MNNRNPRATPARQPVAPMYRGPGAQAVTPIGGVPAAYHAPNAALLIDFDNVTMGIRSDLQSELRSLLSSDIIKGKVAVQRAYADWRRYPQYIVPLSESSIDLIFAPAYGSSKKNATDIRLAIDALELVFTRPEIGTFILLSGDSDFSSLVIKLKEYGKYVIGVGIRESSSDLLVQNCDEYYSYNALAGLVKTGDEQNVPRDPWELVVEAITRMKRNGDVMRSDRLKQVMQEIDPDFDEKNLGMAKFSRFCQEAAQRGLLKITRLENGQMEVDVATEAPPAPAMPAAVAKRAEGERAGRPERAPRGGREEGRRGRRGGRGRGERAERPSREVAAVTEAEQEKFSPPLAEPVQAPPSQAVGDEDSVGERLTRSEVFDLLRRTIADLATGEESVRASDLRRRARELLGRDSETLAERNFLRILRDAHDADVIDLRKRGSDYEVSPAVSAAPIAEQVAPVVSEAAASQASRSAATATALRRGMRPRGRVGRGEIPPELLAVGVVEEEPAQVISIEPAVTGEQSAAVESPSEGGDGRRGGRKSTSKSGRGGRGRKGAKKAAASPDAASGGDAAAAPSGGARRSRGRKKKAATPTGSEA